MGMFELIKMLAHADIDYVVVGGLAVALHGYQRLTMDVDVVLAQPQQIEKWYQEKGMLAFSLRHPEVMATVLDVLVRPVVSFDALRRDATVVTIGELTVPIASINHLIDMKTGTGRSKDQIDILELRKIQSGTTP